MDKFTWWHEPYVPATEAGDNVVFSGDSQTAYDYWPPIFRGLLRGTPTYANVAISGQFLSALVGIDKGTVDPLYSADATTNICFCWAGTNDAARGDSAATIYANLQQYCADRHAAGFKVLVGTVLPRGNAPDPTGYETIRAAYNTLVRNDHSFADGFVDISADPRLGVAGANTNPTFFLSESGVWVHLNQTGGAPIFAGLANQAYRALKLRLFS